MRERFPGIDYADTPEAALGDASAALVVTDCLEIMDLNAVFDVVVKRVVVDGRHAIVYEGMIW